MARGVLEGIFGKKLVFFWGNMTRGGRDFLGEYDAGRKGFFGKKMDFWGKYDAGRLEWFFWKIREFLGEYDAEEGDFFQFFVYFWIFGNFLGIF